MIDKKRILVNLEIIVKYCPSMEKRKFETQTIKEKYISLFKKPESIWLILFATLPLLVGSALAFWALEEKEFLMKLDFWGWFLIFSLLSIPIAFSLIPNTLAGLLAGYFIGMWGFPGMAWCIFLACIMGCYFAKSLDSGIQKEIFKIWPAAEKAAQKLKANSFSVVFLFRLMPVPPFAIGNLLMTWFKIPFLQFVLGSLAGMTIRMILMVWMGAKAKDIIQLLKNPQQVPELQWFTVIGSIAGVSLLYYILRKSVLSSSK